MNKKGFTLVELLAVIVILAIILAIAIPSITSLINNSKKSSFESNVKMLAAGIEYKLLEGTTYATGTDLKAKAADWGGTTGDYASITIGSTSPVTITVVGASGGRFGALTATSATRNTSGTVTP